MKLSPLQKTMAKHMLASWTEVPQFSVECEINCEPLKEFRQEMEFKTSYTTLMIKAVALCVKKHPLFRASFRDDGVIQYEHTNIGIAVDTPKGLLVPVIDDADRKSLAEIHSCMEKIKECGKRGNYTIEQITGGTFTISNLGMFPVSRFTAVVNAPQSAIVALSRMASIPVAKENNEIGTALIMKATVSADHRVLDGAKVSCFLADFMEIVEHPQNLLQ